MIENHSSVKEIVYSWDFGDEHGHLTFPENISFQPGDIVELIVSHCDPTVNLFDHLNIVQNNEVIARWPISLRGCCR